MKRLIILSITSILLLVSCSKKYTTPGNGVSISELATEDIAKILSNKPTATFPVNMAIARIQSPNYTNYRYRRPIASSGNPNFSMILTRNAQEEEGFERLSNLEGITQAAPFNRLLLPYNYNSIKDLRSAAAKMKAGMLLVYTFDSEFVIDTKNYGPQNVFTLGYLKNKEVKVVTTASAALYDVQTEYLFGLAESTSRAKKKSNAWKKQDEVDALRLQTEQEAFGKLLEEIETMWPDVVKEYGSK